MKLGFPFSNGPQWVNQLQPISNWSKSNFSYTFQPLSFLCEQAKKGINLIFDNLFKGINEYFAFAFDLVRAHHRSPAVFNFIHMYVMMMMMMILPLELSNSLSSNDTNAYIIETYVCVNAPFQMMKSERGWDEGIVREMGSFGI